MIHMLSLLWASDWAQPSDTHTRIHYISFYLRDVVSAVIATAMCLAGWVAVRHTPVLYQNG